MKKITTYFFAGLGVALAAFFACFLVDSVQVSADEIVTVVDLSKEQTLALYGNQIQASYYTGTEWRTCTFEYFASSVDFIPFGSSVKTTIVDRDSLGYTTTELDSLIRNNEFLFYRCPVPDPVPTGVSDTSGLQFNIQFSTDVSGISLFRQLIGMAKYYDSTTNINYMPFYSGFNSSATVSFSASPVSFSGRGQYMSYCSGWFSTPVYSSNSSIGGHTINNVAVLPICDILLQDTDSQTGVDNIFSVSGQTLNFNRASVYWLPDNYSMTNPDEASYYYILALSTPRLTDGYILPEPPQTTPNYSSQIDTIIDIGTQNTTILQQILAKLDLIYRQMQQGEESPSLQDPETIGFDSRTKQEILDGVSSADSVLDSVRSSDLPTGASEGIWYAWGRMKDIMPPSLWALYLFALVGGFVGWILYGKRGG